MVKTKDYPAFKHLCFTEPYYLCLIYFMPYLGQIKKSKIL
jgi:hypothetical protein